MRCSIQVDSWKANVWRLTILLSAVVCVAASEPAQAQMRVEEDWVLVVNSADSSDNSPQVTCVISPATMLVGYLALDINYHTQPDYSAGGVQIHEWDPASPSAPVNSNAKGMLQTSGDTVTWTTRMTVNANGTVTYSVVNANSSTWGNFGKDPNGNAFSITTANSLNLQDLSGYSAAVSVANSGVPYAGNRVGSLQLKAVRWYSSATSSQPYYTDGTTKTVYPPQ